MNRVNRDDLFPHGRVVFYEGEDPESFAREVRELHGIDVTAPAPVDWDYPADWEGVRSFFIPPGLMEEVTRSGRWSLGS